KASKSATLGWSFFASRSSCPTAFDRKTCSTFATSEAFSASLALATARLILVSRACSTSVMMPPSRCNSGSAPTRCRQCRALAPSEPLLRRRDVEDFLAARQVNVRQRVLGVLAIAKDCAFGFVESVGHLSQVE